MHVIILKLIYSYDVYHSMLFWFSELPSSLSSAVSIGVDFGGQPRHVPPNHWENSLHFSLFTTFCPSPNILVFPPNIFDKSMPVAVSNNNKTACYICIWGMVPSYKLKKCTLVHVTKYQCCRTMFSFAALLTEHWEQCSHLLLNKHLLVIGIEGLAEGPYTVTNNLSVASNPYSPC